jgi:hypothetical protein
MIRLILSLLLVSCNPAFATLNDVDKSQIFNKNLLKNGGFENGKTYWTPNDTADFSVTSSSPMEGLANAVWDADAAADTLISTVVTVPAGWYGRNGVVSCVTSNASGTATMEIQAYDGSNVLAEATVTSSSTPSRTSANFIFNSSGGMQLRFYANADEPEIEIDSCFLGPADGYNTSNISTAEFVGSAYIAYATNCVWQRTNTATGAMGTDTDCTGPVVEYELVGDFQTTDADLPRFTINNLPPGRYHVKMNFPAAASSASTIQCWAISDGTTTGKENCFSGVTDGNMDVSNDFVYTNAGNRSFEVYGSASTGTMSLIVSAANRNLRMSVFRYPVEQEKAYTPDKLANSWSGFHADDCSWGRTNTAYGDPTADASCTLTELTNTNFGTVSDNASDLPGITFTPSRAGLYRVYAKVSFSSSTSAHNGFLLTDGSTSISYCGQVSTASGRTYHCELTGLLRAASTSAISLKIQTAADTGTVTINEGSTPNTGRTIEWQVFQIDQAVPAPLLVNSVVSALSGVLNICSATITYSAGVPSVAASLGSCVSSVTDNTTGDFTANFVANTFSATPYCMCTGYSNSNYCATDLTSAPTSSAVRFQVISTGDVGADLDAQILCIGSK